MVVEDVPLAAVGRAGRPFGKLGVGRVDRRVTAFGDARDGLAGDQWRTRVPAIVGQQPAHARIAEGAARQLGHVSTDAAHGVEQRLADQLFAQQTDQRLGHRKHNVPVLGTLTVEIALEQHLIALHHQKTIGVTGHQVVEQADAQATATVEAQLAQRLRRVVQGAAWRIPGPHVDGRP